MDQSVINFAVYEDANEYDGMANVTLPDLSSITATINGAGISGNVEVPIIGQYEAMTLGLSFRTPTLQAMRLTEPRRHQIDLRAAIQDEDPVAGQVITRAIKHVFVVIPKSLVGGTVAPASPTDSSGEYAVRYWAQYIDGKKVLEIDPLNNICLINGVDYLADSRKALGK